MSATIVRFAAPRLAAALLGVALAAPAVAQDAGAPAPQAQAAAKPRIVVIGTGGTIAGAGASSVNTGDYDSAKVAVDKIIAAVPEMSQVADVRGEQIFQIGSESFNDERLLKLAKRVSELVKQPDVDAVMITHGTDTIEETSYFLNLTLKTEKPVVIVGAMRPGTALSADGPLNLYNATVVAASPEAKGKGVLVALNDEIHSARDVTKGHALKVEAFRSLYGPLGVVVESKPYFYRLPARPHTTATEFDIDRIDSLPKVDVFYAHVTMDPKALTAIADLGGKALIYAGTGNGSVADYMEAPLAEVRKKALVVRATRTGGGMVIRNGEEKDDEQDWVAAGDQSPQKARILTALALTTTDDPKALQEIFWKY
ncbi:asparaginase [Methylopila turkensis]|uniref:Glutaminase-asparaginase n=1 Tax=Methylopila turkensis TaxID=1437816 RepID=A0A9W6N7A7_9HYPH|nr:asparaginase [Methylopila turkensis]GLK80202.1 glutaminase-asparaginase [Methylopila turkensis]